MKIIRRGLLVVLVAVLLLLALENVLIFWLMMDLGVPRGAWMAAIEFLIFAAFLIILIWRGRWSKKQPPQ